MSSVVRAALCTSLVSMACGEDTTGNTGPTSGTSTGGDATGDASTGGDQTSTDNTTGNETSSPTQPSTTGDSDDPTGGMSSVLVSIDDQHDPPRLLRIDATTGTATQVCTLPIGATYDSIAFTPDGTLFAHNLAQSRLETINPCNCGFQIVGATGTGPLEISQDGSGGLVALDLALDAFSIVNPSTGLASVVGPLGIPVSAAGLAWDDDAGHPLMIDGGALYEIASSSGLATQVATLSQTFSTLGMDVRLPDGQLFVCAAGTLHGVDRTNGTIETIGTLGLVSSCHNLAVPPSAIACLE
jgi:hypothetical protein